MSLTCAHTLAEKLKPLAPLAMCLAGGEPLLHPNLIDLAGLLARDHYLDLVTNGYLMTPDLAGDLFKFGLSEISVSIDYALAKEHDAQRGLEGLFDRAAAALEYLAAKRVKPEQRVRLVSVVMEDNLDHIEPLSDLCQKLGVKHNLTLYVPGRGHGGQPADLSAVVKRLKDIQKRKPALLIVPGYLEGFEGRGRAQCRNGVNLMAIDPLGRALRCIDRVDKPAGSIITDDLKVVLAKLKKQALENPCNRCWTSCRGVVEPLLYGPKKIKNWLYQLRAIRSEPIINPCGHGLRGGGD
jgi:MoaA/NifB/PqqE/SkfB family radical SAM enzyme